MSEVPIKDFRELYRKHEFSNPTFFHSPLWHYTSGNGLAGIIRNKPEERGKLHFWFTRSDCLNDTSEGNHILDLYRAVCDDLLHESTIDEHFYDLIKDIEISAQQLINYPVPSSDGITHSSVFDSAPCHAFICCFSKKEDSLDMWRYYSKGDGGYGIKCAPFLFDHYKGFEYSEYNEKAIFSMMRAYEIIYANSEKVKILCEIVKDTFSAYQNTADEDEQKIVNAQSFIRGTLKRLQFQFKHECYASEQEYRFVFYRPYSKPKELRNELPPVRYRMQNGVIVPYIDLVIENGVDYLDEILISPYINSDFALATTCEYLAECGCSCNVRRSTLPVRV